jgi:hypothetical protein
LSAAFSERYEIRRRWRMARASRPPKNAIRATGRDQMMPPAAPEAGVTPVLVGGGVAALVGEGVGVGATVGATVGGAGVGGAGVAAAAMTSTLAKASLQNTIAG